LSVPWRGLGAAHTPAYRFPRDLDGAGRPGGLFAGLVAISSAGACARACYSLIYPAPLSIELPAFPGFFYCSPTLRMVAARFAVRSACVGRFSPAYGLRWMDLCPLPSAAGFRRGAGRCRLQRRSADSRCWYRGRTLLAQGVFVLENRADGVAAESAASATATRTRHCYLPALLPSALRHRALMDLPATFSPQCKHYTTRWQVRHGRSSFRTLPLFIAPAAIKRRAYFLLPATYGARTSRFFP